MKTFLRKSSCNISSHLSSLHSTPSLQQFRCSTAQEALQEKNLELSAVEFDDTSDHDEEDNEDINSLPESISQSKTFQTVSQSTARRHSGIEFSAWERQNRVLPTVDSSHRFASILNARSAEDIREGLDWFKESAMEGQAIRRKNQILTLLDTISDSKPETETQSDDLSNSDDAISEDADNVTTDSTTDSFEFISKYHQNGNSDTDSTQKRMVSIWELSEAYCKAIQMCSNLRLFDDGMQIFEECKKQRRALNANVFASAMQLVLDQNFDVSSLDKCYELKYEMEDNYKCKASARMYQVLINAAIDLREYRRCKGMVKHVLRLDDEEKRRLLTDKFFYSGKFLRISICRYYATLRQFNNGLEFMGWCAKNLGNWSVCNEMYSSMIGGCALAVNHGDESMVEIGEKLFKQSFEMLGKAPREPVFISLMNLYANVPDFASCLDMLKAMNGNENWPKPTALSYSVCLKSLNRYGQHHRFTHEEGWNKVEEVLEMMKENGIKAHTPIYSLLFHLCSGSFCDRPDLDKLYGYYEQMMEEKVSVNPNAAQNLLLSGLDAYVWKMENGDGDKEELREKCQEFVDWALSQYKRHNITLIQYHQDLMNKKLQRIM